MATALQCTARCFAVSGTRQVKRTVRLQPLFEIVLLSDLQREVLDLVTRKVTEIILIYSNALWQWYISIIWYFNCILYIFFYLNFTLCNNKILKARSPKIYCLTELVLPVSPAKKLKTVPTLWGPYHKTSLISGHRKSQNGQAFWKSCHFPIGTNGH